MTLPTGTISFNQINTELRRTATAQLSLNDETARTLAGVGSSGTIFPMDHLQGKTHRIAFQVNVTSNTTDALFHAQTMLWNSGYKIGFTDVLLVINAGVLVYSTMTSQAAFRITGFHTGDTLWIVNYGTIHGKGGKGGDGGDNPGSVGGDAILLGHSARISNESGYIAGGGGGGGGGAGPVVGGGYRYTGGGGGAGGGAGGFGYVFGGAGGMVIPGVGGAGGVQYQPSSGVAEVAPGSAGTAGGGGAGYNSGGVGGSGGNAGGNAINTISGNALQGFSKGGGGGGGWGAKGGTGSHGYSGGNGGKAIYIVTDSPSGLPSVTWVGGFPSTRVFGAIS